MYPRYRSWDAQEYSCSLIGNPFDTLGFKILRENRIGIVKGTKNDKIDLSYASTIPALELGTAL